MRPLLVAIGFLTACAEYTAPAVVASIEVAPSTQTLTAVGQTQTFNAVVKDQYGKPFAGPSVVWRSAQPNIATIDAATGVATAIANGVATITATADTSTGTATLTVRQVATRLAFITQPLGGTAGRTFSPVVMVQIEDAGGTSVTTASDMVTVAIGMNPGGATLAGTATVAALGGVATFSGIYVDKAGAGYTLVASSGTFTGSTTDPFTILPSHGPFAQIAAGYVHTCGINGSGTAYCWGANSLEQLGDDTSISRPHPEQVSGGHAFTAIAAGWNHTCGITAGGAMYCWGEGSLGQLGDGSSTDQFSPALVSGSLTFTAVTAGYAHTCGFWAMEP